jgi:hypothetical protein
MGPFDPFSPPTSIPIQRQDIGCCGSGHMQYDPFAGGLSSQGSLIRPDYDLRRQRTVDSLDLMGRNHPMPDPVRLIDPCDFVSPPVISVQPDPDLSWMDRIGRTRPIVDLYPEPEQDWMDRGGLTRSVFGKVDPDPDFAWRDDLKPRPDLRFVDHDHWWRS